MGWEDDRWQRDKGWGMDDTLKEKINEGDEGMVKG